MKYKIRSVEVVRYPVLRVTFDDELSGELDLTSLIDSGPVYRPLKNEAFFNTVGVADHGHSFGWNLDDLGHEIDFCPDATRIEIESNIVKAAAAEFRAQRSAAE